MSKNSARGYGRSAVEKANRHSLDPAGRRRLVDRYMHLVEAIASTVYRDVREHIEKDDLIGWGTTGLLEAAERYDPGLGTSFATFAYYRIRGAIYDGLRKMTQLPHRRYRRFAAAQRASEYLEHAGQRTLARRNATPGNPASTVESLRELYDTMRSIATMLTISLDDYESSGQQPLSSEQANADALLVQKRLRQKLQQAIAALPNKERHFIEQCYYEGKSVSAAGRQLGLSRSWSSRLHARAVERLRDRLVKDEK